jgi:hypothetical protein
MHPNKVQDLRSKGMQMQREMAIFSLPFHSVSKSHERRIQKKP